MLYRKSRAQRETAFLEVATRLYAQLEDWYDQHPIASFAEFEVEARRVRQELMGQGLALVITGRDTGARVKPPLCPQCCQSMEFTGYRPWGAASAARETEVQPACYVCRACEKQMLFHPQSQTATAVEILTTEIGVRGYERQFENGGARG
jgi:hypothetical protein